MRVEGDMDGCARMVTKEVLAEVSREFPDITVDAFCDKEAWSVEACVRLFEKARKHHPIRVHSDRFNSLGMIPEAVRLHAASVDHLEAATKADLTALAGSPTFGVILPCTGFHTDQRFAKAGFFADQGGALALATDCNPGTSPTHSMPFAIALAVRFCGLRPARRIVAATVNPAVLLGYHDRGTIEVGKRADLIMLQHKDERLLAHRVRRQPGRHRDLQRRRRAGRGRSTIKPRRRLRPFATYPQGFSNHPPMLALLTLAALPAFDLAAFEKPRLVAEAEAALAVAPKTVTATRNPRSAGGLHDFSSEGDYWWPDRRNPAGPYVQRDGLSNPDNFVAHRQALLAFGRAFDALAAAYRLTHDEKFAAAAVKHLHAWFVDPSTRMNPNLLYSQAIQGISTGRSIGVIDTLHLAEVALGIEVLRGAKAFPPDEEAAVTAWFRDYLAWMTTHPYGVDESNAKNNHGTCAWLQIACFAHLTGDAGKLAAARARFKEVLLPSQMAADGSFPEELRRTKPYGYSIFNLDVMTALAVVCSTPRENLMTWSLPDGRNLVKGVAWLAPYLADKGEWLKRVHKALPGKGGAAEMSNELVKPDVMYWDDRPVRQPCLIFRRARRRPRGLARDMAKTEPRSRRRGNHPQLPDPPAGALGEVAGRARWVMQLRA
jgi:hypothetical protein